jgi:hypothetical protein
MTRLLHAAVLATAIAVAGLFATAAAPTTARAETNVSVSFNYFHSSLSPYGRWYSHPRYGRIWRPYGLAVGWRPYTYGRWVWTDDYGWMWMSYYDWGWARLHLGPGLGRLALRRRLHRLVSAAARGAVESQPRHRLQRHQHLRLLLHALLGVRATALFPVDHDPNRRRAGTGQPSLHPQNHPAYSLSACRQPGGQSRHRQELCPPCYRSAGCFSAAACGAAARRLAQAPPEHQSRADLPSARCRAARRPDAWRTPNIADAPPRGAAAPGSAKSAAQSTATRAAPGATARPATRSAQGSTTGPTEGAASAPGPTTCSAKGSAARSAQGAASRSTQSAA